MFTIRCFHVCSPNLSRVRYFLCSNLFLFSVAAAQYWRPVNSEWFSFLLFYSQLEHALETLRSPVLTWKIVMGIEKSAPPVILKPRVFPIPWNSSRSELPFVTEIVGACFSILNVTCGISRDLFQFEMSVAQFSFTFFWFPRCYFFTPTRNLLIQLLIEVITY